jgi:hypothetical protein
MHRFIPAGALEIGMQSRADRCDIHPNDGIGLGIEALGTAESLYRYLIFLRWDAIRCCGSIKQVLQNSSKGIDGPELRAFEDAPQKSTLSGNTD